MNEKQTPNADTADEAYELDLDENHSQDIDGAIEDAVAAVENGRITIQVEDGDEDETDAEPDDAPSSLAAERAAKFEKEATDLRDRLARTMADFDNFRKRSEREKAASASLTTSNVLSDFLGVIDNLERANVAAGSVEDLKIGVEMILRQLNDTFRRYNAHKIDAVGQPFDPTRHEAVSKQESPDVDQPMVVAELQAGYTLGDRLLRPAMVTVAMPASPSSQEGAGEESGSSDSDEDPSRQDEG